MSVLDLKGVAQKASKRLAQVDSSRCAACGECVHFCPRSAASVVNGSYAAIDSEKCIGCGRCEKNCPAGCILIIDREQVSKNEK